MPPRARGSNKCLMCRVFSSRFWFFFPPRLALRVSRLWEGFLHVWALGCCRAGRQRVPPACLRLRHVPAVNTNQRSVFAACGRCVKDNTEMGKRKIFLTSSNIREKESRFSDERAPFRAAC